MDYYIREQTSLLSREMLVEDHAGKRLFRVHGPLVRIRDELRLDDSQGAEQAWIKDPVLGDSTKFEIYRAGAHVADVKTVAVGNLLEGYDLVVLAGGEPLRARGNVFARDFSMTQQGRPAARVRRHANAVEVSTQAGQDDVLLLAGVIAMASMADLRARATARHS
ncbi:MAG: hypothetical protein JO057_02120 [Chloroflexi bacterium]|nr:hypothetical protein [Chloroflexota bacterium]